MIKLKFCLTLTFKLIVLFLTFNFTRFINFLIEKMKFQNKLINSKSPYLLQHAENPVDWNEWNEETLEMAKKENKPMFISIGYSTCHWCHVMAHESFEDEEIAELINKSFIPIKVDREELPEIDSHYMNYCRVLSQSCGWPLSVFAMPNGKPFFIATYIPPKSKHGYIGFKDLLNRLSALWESAPDRIFVMAQEAEMQVLSANITVNKNIDDIEILNNNLNAHFKASYDAINGGFSPAPKFPTPFIYEYLFKEYKINKDETLLKSALYSLEKMRLGGIFDHLGGGFHRYSTDDKWLVPHFEKMLYDQAGLIIAYSLAYQISHDEFYKDTAYSIINYLKNNLLSEHGAFYSAEDADQDREEGKYYVWDYKEILDSSSDSDVLIKALNINKNGNFSDPLNPNENKNIIYLSDRLESIIVKNSINKNDFERGLDSLKALRQTRKAPFRDEKILCDWNGYVIAALSIAGRIFGDKKITKLATICADFILKNAFIDKNLLHSFYEDSFRIDGTLDDYAYLSYGLIELSKSSLNIKYLNKAKELTNIAIEKFQDKESGEFFLNQNKGIFKSRIKELYDNAFPSSSSIMFYVLTELWLLCKDDCYKKTAEIHFSALAPEITRYTPGFAFIMSKYELFKSGGIQVIIIGDKKSAKKFILEFNKFYLPLANLVFLDIDKKNTRRIFNL